MTACLVHVRSINGIACNIVRSTALCRSDIMVILSRAMSFLCLWGCGQRFCLCLNSVVINTATGLFLVELVLENIDLIIECLQFIIEGGV